MTAIFEGDKADRDADLTPDTRWGVVLIATAAGMLAGMQLGKAAPALPFLREDLGIGMVTAGWISSAFNLVGTVTGILTGYFAGRLEARGLVASGLFILTLSSVAGAFAMSSEALIVSRILGGIGLVAISVAAPRLIVVAASTRDTSLVLGVWSTYMPVGMAMAMLLGPPLLNIIGWRGLWCANGLLLFAFLLLFLWLTRDEPKAATRASKNNFFQQVYSVLRYPGPWLLCGSFAFYCLQFNAVVSWLPTLLMESKGYSASTAGLLGALVIGANIVGNLTGAWWLYRGGRRWLLQLGACLGMALCAVGIFTEVSGSVWNIAAAVLFSAVGGLLPAAILAGTAAHAQGDEQIGMINGLIVHGNNLGNLAGAPILAMVVSFVGNWNSGWWLMAIYCGFGALLALMLRYVEAKQDVSGQL